MNTSLANHEPKLLVCIESGRVLRGDDHPIISIRWANSHPFIERAGRTLFAGPDAARAVRVTASGGSVRHLNVYEYEISDEVAGGLRLTRKVDA